MKLIGKKITGIFASIAVLFLSSVVFFGFVFSGGDDCGSNSIAVQKAKSLSAEELEQLYYHMSVLEKDSEIDFKEWTGGRLSSPNLPEAIKRLQPRKVTLYGPRITLAGCMDHFVILWFHGLGSPESKSRDPGIQLQWGEHTDHGKLYLWKPEA